MFPSIKTLLFLAIFLRATSSQFSDENSDYEDLEIVDQRQNGTENYRLHVNGVVMVVSPPMGLFSSAEILDSDLIAVNQNKPNKPQNPTNGNNIDNNLIDGKPIPAGNSAKSTDKVKMKKMRLPFFLARFLNRRAQPTQSL